MCDSHVSEVTSRLRIGMVLERSHRSCCEVNTTSKCTATGTPAGAWEQDLEPKDRMGVRFVFHFPAS